MKNHFSFLTDKCRMLTQLYLALVPSTELVLNSEHSCVMVVVKDDISGSINIINSTQEYIRYILSWTARATGMHLVTCLSFSLIHLASAAFKILDTDTFQTLKTSWKYANVSIANIPRVQSSQLI